MSGRRAILVAEDDLNDAFFLERAFAHAGINVPARFVKTGREAIDYLQGNPPFDQRGRNPLPTLLVLDLKMPVVNGFEVLEWVRRDAKLHQIPVVVLSGSENPHDVNLAYAMGANAYLAKPHRAADLCKLIKPVLQKYGAMASRPSVRAVSVPSRHPA
jgi:CheY-like chemotaxis protein